MLPHLLSLLAQGKIVAPFIILHGPGVDKQWSSVIQSCQELCGFFAYHDVLEIRDYSKELGKNHTLRVEYDKTHDDSKLLLKEHNYEDKGSREINDRLAHAPSGEIKVLLIEHIDRANNNASNALLKSLEEPLPGRITIVSTTNKDLLLPTILSRALLIHCDTDYAPSILDEEGKKLLSDTIDALASKNIAVLNKSASQISKYPSTENIIDNMIYHYTQQGQYDKIPLFIHALRMMKSNVSAEHSIFQLFLKLVAQ